MPLTISRIGQARGRPVAQGFGICGTITRYSASVRSVWYRVTGRLCCCRVVGVHMANPRLVQETLGLVLLSGEAGIGKSRLTAALLERLAGEPHTRLRYFCSPQQTDSALYPIISQMERAAGLAHDDTPQARLDKLDALLAQTSTSIQ